MNKKIVSSLFVSFVSIVITGCAAHKQTGATPFIKGKETMMVGDPLKRDLSDKGPLFKWHRYAQKDIQYKLERDMAEIEAEAILRDFAAEKGVPYTARPVGGGRGTQAQRQQVPVQRPQQRSSPQYRYNRNGAPFLLPQGGGVSYGTYGAGGIVANQSLKGQAKMLTSGLKSFFLPHSTSGQTASFPSASATVRVRGRVNVPVTGFEKSAIAHARQVNPNFDRERRYGANQTVLSKGVAVVGQGRFVSGLPHR